MKTIGYKMRYCSTLVISVLLSVMFNININAQQETDDDKTLSPYFFIDSDDPATDKLPLKATSAEVNIAGVIADVRVIQVYKNEGKNAIEAIYVFPASTRAAVYSMKMTIGDRTIVAEIREKEKARQEYEQAKQEGKSASLLEQQRPNVFQMNVANIMPGDEIKVEMFYTELLIPEDGVYEFAYPTVVGPRYSNQPEASAPESEKWVSNPYTTEGTKPMYTFDISVNINAGLPVSDVKCISHDANINFDGPSTAAISPKNKNEGNKDFIVQYRLSGNQIESGLLLYQGKDENFFLAMMQPPKKVVESQIPPREYVFIVDVSGSMYGFPLDISKKLMKNLLSNLKPTDKFNVMLFAGGSKVLAERSLDANESNIQKAIRFIDNENGGGGTELLPALQKALALQGTENYSRSFVIATDGYVTVEKEAFDLIRNNLGKANFFAFGIGSSVNRYIIEGMAHVGYGEPLIITDPNDADKKADKFREYIQKPVLTNIEVAYPGFTVYDVEPLSVPDILAERPVIIYGKWKGTKGGKITLKGRAGDKDYTYSLDVASVKASDKNIALKYLWAREKIRLLDDYTKVSYDDKDHINQITQLGLKYNLLTNYTSFIAIDSEVRNANGTSTTVKQPLPLPEGVSNYAVGGASGAYGAKTKRIANAPSVKLSCDKSGYANEGFSNNLEIVDSEEAVEEDIFIIVEEQPKFQGGEMAMMEFIANNIIYPESAKMLGIQGKVIVQFIVDEVGNIKDIKVIQGLSKDLDNEAIRVIKLMSGKWNPGKQGGKAVKTTMVLPVTFKLQQ
ncbi:MAG: TonB family protein [Bacteroidales bacterium]|nr:TonB family protein [Bacteroidales bacterium]